MHIDINIVTDHLTRSRLVEVHMFACHMHMHMCMHIHKYMNASELVHARCSSCCGSCARATTRCCRTFSSSSLACRHAHICMHMFVDVLVHACVVRVVCEEV